MVHEGPRFTVAGAPGVAWQSAVHLLREELRCVTASDHAVMGWWVIDDGQS